MEIQLLRRNERTNTQLTGRVDLRGGTIQLPKWVSRVVASLHMYNQLQWQALSGLRLWWQANAHAPECLALERTNKVLLYKEGRWGVKRNVPTDYWATSSLFKLAWQIQNCTQQFALTLQNSVKKWHRPQKKWHRPQFRHSIVWSLCHRIDSDKFGKTLTLQIALQGPWGGHIHSVFTVAPQTQTCIVLPLNTYPCHSTPIPAHSFNCHFSSAPELVDRWGVWSHKGSRKETNLPERKDV